MYLRTAFASACALVMIACGSSPGDTPEPAPTTPETQPPRVNGPIAATPPNDPTNADPRKPALPYPAFRPEPPEVISGGGKVLAAPKIALVVYPDEPRTKTAESFVTKIGASTYWSAVTKEYGVGPASALPTVTRTDAPPQTLDDAEIKTWLASQLDGTHPEYPSPDENTVYMMVYPAGTTITAGGKTYCPSAFAYHAEAALGDGRSVPYIVLPHCSSPNYTDDDLFTIAMSHELVEAAVDPRLATSPAYARVDDQHLPWITTIGGTEPGDLCADLETQSPELGVVVQRSWSNVAAKTGHHPCVPAKSTPYFGAAAAVDKISILNGTFPGVKIPVGQSKTVDIQLFSDAPTDDFEVIVRDAATLSGDPAQLSFTLDRAYGHNGDVLHLTVTATKPGHYGTTTGFSTFVVIARSKTGDFAFWPAFVAN